MRLVVSLAIGVLLTLTLLSLSGAMIATLPFVVTGAYLYWNSGKND
jgi:hypothetical protein